MKKMSVGAIVGIVLLGIVIVFGIWGVSGYNNLVVLKESVDNSYSNIDVQLQRRMDLIPNVVASVKGYTAHESEVLEDISESRAKLAGASSVGEKASANADVSGALSRLLVVVENYPALKADTQFTALMDELSGTENRISVARTDYNSAVQKYNAQIKKFPTVIVATMFGFSSAERFEANAKASEAPAVNFG